MTARRSIRWAWVMLILTGALLTASLWRRASVAPMTRDVLAANFESDLRYIVYEWDPEDSRPLEERRRALFDFVYEAYKASAWIPQSLFDSNLVTQAVVGDVNTIVGDKVGLVLWKDNALVPAFGMAPNAAWAPVDSDDLRAAAAATREPLKWTVNCLVCHTAEIDGVAYLGAGTKTFDELWTELSEKAETRPEGSGTVAALGNLVGVIILLAMKMAGK